jgi:hypothetical protein
VRGYNLGEGNQRASLNGRVSDLPPSNVVSPAGWASPSSRGRWGGEALLLSTRCWEHKFSFCQAGAKGNQEFSLSVVQVCGLESEGQFKAWNESTEHGEEAVFVRTKGGVVQAIQLRFNNDTYDPLESTDNDSSEDDDDYEDNGSVSADETPYNVEQYSVEHLNSLQLDDSVGVEGRDLPERYTHDTLRSCAVVDGDLTLRDMLQV